MPKRANKFYTDHKSTLYNLETKLIDHATKKKSGKGKHSDEEPEQHIAENENSDIEDKDEQQKESNNDLVANRRMLRVRRHNQDNEIERQLTHSTMTLITSVDHCDFPSFNQGLWPQAERDGFATYPSCSFSIPRPIHASKAQCQTIDLCYKRPFSGESFRKSILIARTTHNKFLSHKKNKAAEKKGLYHRGIYDFAERLNTQSNPTFYGSYDYFYAGGNLCTLPQSGNIVHASGENLQTLELSKYSTVDHYPAANYLTPLSSSYQTSENDEIFEIKPFLTSPSTSHRNSFICRKRNLITINRISENEEIKAVRLFRTKKTPFLSFAQSDRNYDTLLITNMKQHIRMYDLSCDTPRMVKIFEIKPDAITVCWNTIKSWRENTFLYANDYKLTVVDTRTTPDQWMTSAILTIQNNYICDHIASIAKSQYNNLFYVGTNHRLHCMDMRQIKKNSFVDPEAVICRWSHQLQYAPLMMETYRIANTEFVALSSPLAGDLHVCQLNRERNSNNFVLKENQRVPKHIYRSPCLPYQPPTLLEAYESATLVGKCLQPKAKLANRLKACTTGMTFCKPAEFDSDSALVELLTLNSLGDIFSYTLSKRESNEADSRGNSRSNEIMNEFANKLAAINHPLNYSEIKNFKCLRKVYLCPYLNADVKYDIDAMDDSYSETEAQAADNAFPIRAKQVKKKRKRLHMGRWQKSFATLNSYKDALVPDLLSIWDIEMDEDHKNSDLNKLQSSLNVKTDPALKVRDWLDTNVNSDSQPMTRLPLNVVADYIEDVANKTTESMGPTSTNDVENFSFLNLTDINISQCAMDFENVVQSTQVMENSIQFDATVLETQLNNVTTTSLDKSKTKKKAKKYVKGF